MKYIFILNGRQDKLATQQDILRQLADAGSGCLYEVYETEGMGDATRYVRVYCDLHPAEEVCFVACGGNGMINEVASGLIGFGHKTLGILSIGGGANDFIKYYPDHCFSDVKKLLQGEDLQIDAIRVNDNYCINVCNFGFDSVVGKTANLLMAKGKTKNAYRIGVFKAIFTGRFNRIQVWADGEKLGKKRMLLCTLGNGKYVGSEFCCAPRALNNDGLIEVCYLRTMSLLHFIRLLPAYTQGRHLDDARFRKKILYRQARKVSVSSPNLIELYLDGEPLPGSHFDIEILPQAVRLRIPQKQ